MYRPAQPRHRRRSLDPDEKHLPEGQCRYIMLHPEVKGLRCGCVCFSLNRDTPGSSCDCGHQACYHLPVREDSPTSQDEIVRLKDRVAELEAKLQSERMADRRSLVLRISQLEELLDRCKAEMEGEVRSAFRGIEALWHNVGQLQRHGSAYDDRLEALVDTNHAVRDDVRTMGTRIGSLDDMSMQLEDRIDALESARLGSVRHASSPPDLCVEAAEEAPTSFSGQPCGFHAWTVHVSLLPKASQPFPFEQTTAAYRRCVSRGMHRVVTVPDRSRDSFHRTISEEFSSLLHGRSWMPLVAKLCDAQTLAGLPMLKLLPPQKIDNRLYDYEFLRNCATLGEDGRILDLYIALETETFSWAELRRSKLFKEGLESCWRYDPVLDGPRNDDDMPSYVDSSDEAGFGEPSAGDILRAWSPPTARQKKRTASSISRASSFGSADGEVKRSKIQQRQRGAISMEVPERRAEAV